MTSITPKICEAKACIKHIDSKNGKLCGMHRMRVIRHGDMYYEGRKYHGMNRSPEHLAWKSMKQRCYNPKFKQYKDWGGRGIKVCDEWLDDFGAFYKYIGEKPSEKYSLDRISVDGNYEPGNVRWATPREQVNNKRLNSETRRRKGSYKPAIDVLVI